METNWKQANRYFYALARRCNMSHEDIVATIVGNYPSRVSTSELTATELQSLCRALQQRVLSAEEQDKDRWRKRLIAVVRHYLEQMGYRTDMVYIRDVIVRAAAPQGSVRFNDLPLDRLRSLYNAFRQRCKDLEAQLPADVTKPKKEPMAFAAPEA